MCSPRQFATVPAQLSLQPNSRRILLRSATRYCNRAAEILRFGFTFPRTFTYLLVTRPEMTRTGLSLCRVIVINHRRWKVPPPSSLTSLEIGRRLRSF